MWKKLFSGVQRNEDQLPQHVAIIMDGNGRWATGQGLIRTAGHKAGVKTLKKIVKACTALGLNALTVYAFSTENWKRPHAEVDFLMDLFSEYLAKEIDEMDEEMKRRFEITFNAIKKEFNFVFPSLFGGGRAELFLPGGF